MRRRRRERAWPEPDGPARPCLLRMQPVARTALVRGAVVWAHVPFTEDGSAWKTRPAVVVDASGRDITLFPLTSSLLSRHRPGVVAVTHWVEAGLSRPCSMVRRPVTLDRMDILNLVGHLHEDDLVESAGGVPA
jgi:hypothetical protein